MDNVDNKNPGNIPEEITGSEPQVTVSGELKSWLITIGIGAVIVLAIFLYRSNREANEAKASRMLGEARNMQALQAIMNQYPSASAARLALLQMAKAQYDNGDYVASQASYKLFLAKYPSHPMAAIAELGIIHCTEGMGQVEQALAAYTAFLTKNPNHYLTATAILSKARCLQSLKRYTEAKATYENFLVDHPKSDWKTDIEEELKLLDRQTRQAQVKL